MNIAQQQEKAKQLRADILKMLYTCQSGHPGGSLSCVEMLMALYYNTIKVDPKNPRWEDRDRVVLSKGHACPALYAVLADMGFFPREDLWDLRQINSHLQGHPDCTKTPGVDVNTGSLGQGVSIAGGLAMAAKLKKKAYQIYAIIGDGEAQEGLVWEAAMSAAHYKLDNLTVMLDHNGLQIDGSNDEVMSIGDIVKKYESFGFECITVDGHDIQAIVGAIEAPHNGKPKFICCQTHKGHGVSFMSDQYGWHGKAPSKDDYERAIKELGVAVNG
ncbi:transketolase [Marasmitruncus massiliensis]|uniref:transketolase n=1 Tax=Marasmitruncus massiliensis TaxID=1944642 RepID=UPI000C7A2FFC|nr:transketolase [Marasmitruncus massiliensis]